MCGAVLLVLIGVNSKRMALWSTSGADFSPERSTHQPVREATYQDVRGHRYVRDRSARVEHFANRLIALFNHGQLDQHCDSLVGWK
jgi:hypothetical protein